MCHHVVTLIWIILSLDFLPYDVSITITGVCVVFMTTLLWAPLSFYKNICWWKTFNLCCCQITLQKSFKLMTYIYPALVILHICLQIAAVTNALTNLKRMKAFLLIECKNRAMLICFKFVCLL